MTRYNGLVCRVEQLAADLRGPSFQFLSVGDSLLEVDRVLLALGWRGTQVAPPGHEEYCPTQHAVRICGVLTDDPRFVRIAAYGNDLLSRSFTIREVFDAYNGPFAAVISSYPGRVRHVLNSEQVRAASPWLMALADDGNNKELVESWHGYAVERFDGALLLHRPRRR